MAGFGVGHNGFAAFNEANAKSGNILFRSGAALTGALIKNKEVQRHIRLRNQLVIE